MVTAAFVGKSELSCLIWVMPCKPQIVHEIHGEKQFKIPCLSVFCVLETVKPFHVVTGGQHICRERETAGGLAID